MRISDWSSDVCSSDLAANACSNDSGLFHFAPSPAAQSPDAVRACPAGDIGFSPDLFMSRATVSDISCGLNGSQGSRKGGGENYVAQKHLRLWRREGATLMIIWRDRKSTRLNSSH